MELEDLHLIDLTHPLHEKIPSWSGKCGFEHHLKMDFSPQQSISFKVFKVSMHAGIGTHVDAPSHAFAKGKTVDMLGLKDLFCPAFTLHFQHRCTADLCILPSDIIEFERKNGNIQPGSFVIFHTGWSQFWTNPVYYHNNYRFPYVHADTIELLLERKINGLGVDTLSPDRPGSGFPTHAGFLGANKYLVENIANANQLPPLGAYIGIFPLPLQGGTEASARVVGFLPARKKSRG